MDRLFSKKAIYVWIFILIYSFSFLGNTHKVNVDEPWESITAHQFAQKGELSNPVLSGREHFEQHFLQPRILQSLILSIPYKFFGPNLIVGRIVSVLFSLAAFFVFYLLLRKNIISENVSLICLILLVLHNLIYVYSRMIRPEVYFMFIALVNMFFIWKGIEEKSSPKIFIAGLFTGIGMFTHPNYLLFSISFLVILIFEFRLKILKHKFFYLFGIASIIGFLPYGSYIIYQDWGNGMQHFWAQVSNRVQQDNSTYLLTTFIDEFERYKGYIYFPYRLLPFLLELYLLALTFRVKRNKLLTYSRIVLLVHVCLFPILIVSRVERYFVPILPFLLILFAQVFEEANLEFGKKYFNWEYYKKNKFIPFTIVLLVTYQLIGNVIITVQQHTMDYVKIGNELTQVIPKKARVWGSMKFWFHFYDYNYRTQYTYLKDLYVFLPEYVITHEDAVWGRVNHKLGVQSKSSRWAPIALTMNEYCENYGTIIKEFEETGYGKIKVWKINTSLISEKVIKDYIPPNVID